MFRRVPASSASYRLHVRGQVARRERGPPARRGDDGAADALGRAERPQLRPARVAVDRDDPVDALDGGELEQPLHRRPAGVDPRQLVDDRVGVERRLRLRVLRQRVQPVRGEPEPEPALGLPEQRVAAEREDRERLAARDARLVEPRRRRRPGAPGAPARRSGTSSARPPARARATASAGSSVRPRVEQPARRRRPDRDHHAGGERRERGEAERERVVQRAARARRPAHGSADDPVAVDVRARSRARSAPQTPSAAARNRTHGSRRRRTTSQTTIASVGSPRYALALARVRRAPSRTSEPPRPITFVGTTNPREVGAGGRAGRRTSLPVSPRRM